MREGTWNVPQRTPTVVIGYLEVDFPEDVQYHSIVRTVDAHPRFLASLGSADREEGTTHLPYRIYTTGGLAIQLVMVIFRFFL
jgi:hypothetical protein